MLPTPPTSPGGTTGSVREKLLPIPEENFRVRFAYLRSFLANISEVAGSTLLIKLLRPCCVGLALLSEARFGIGGSSGRI